MWKLKHDAVRELRFCMLHNAAKEIIIKLSNTV